MRRRSARARNCSGCGAPVLEREVLVGKLPGRFTVLRIDAAPHPDGEVVRRSDGVLRMLPPGAVASTKAYRVHTTRSCGTGRWVPYVPERAR